MRSPRRLTHTVAVLGALLSVAATGVVGDVLARDTKSQVGFNTSMGDEMRALAAAANAQAPVPCAGGVAAGFPCQNIDLASIVPIAQLGVELGSDIWGWTDSETGREIAIPTTFTGMAFVDVTVPDVPIILGRMNIGQGVDSGVFWRDVKVFNDHAYLVSEHNNTGLQIFDLTRLRSIVADQGVLTADAVLDDFSSAHNIHINTATGIAYVVGSNECAGGLLMYDLNGDPVAPTQVGCFDQDGYVHDVECVVYHGPDTRFTDHEICFASDEDTVTIVDVTDKAAPVMLARHGYPTAAYTHQGDLTPDHEWFIFGDEGDESKSTVPNTATYIVNVADLTAPGEVLTYLHSSQSIDHNLYIYDGYVWQSNYMQGLVVLDYDVATLGDGVLTQVGSFDVMPGADINDFAGAWSHYGEFPSRTVVLNSSEVGMFILSPTLEVQPDATPVPAPEPEPAPEPTTEPAPAPETAPAGQNLPATGGGMALAGLALAAFTARRR